MSMAQCANPGLLSDTSLHDGRLDRLNGCHSTRSRSQVLHQGILLCLPGLLHGSMLGLLLEAGHGDGRLATLPGV